MSNFSAIELFILGPNDVDYDEQTFEIREPLTVYLLEIKNLLTSEPGTVIGAMDKGVDLESLVFEMNLEEDEINQRITAQIQKYCTLAPMFNTKIETKFTGGVVRDICFIDVIVDSNRYLQFRLT